MSRGRVCLPWVGGVCKGGAGEGQEVQGWAEQRPEEFRRVDFASLKIGGNSQRSRVPEGVGKQGKGGGDGGSKSQSVADSAGGGGGRVAL